MAHREQEIQLLEQRVETLGATIASLRRRIDESKSIQSPDSTDTYILIEAAVKVFRPVIIRLRASSGKTNDEVMSELEKQIRREKLDAESLARGLLNFKILLGSHVNLSEGSLSLGVDQTRLQEKFLDYVSQLKDEKLSEKLNSSIQQREIEERLIQAEKDFIEAETQLAKLRPKQASDLSPSELAELGRKFNLPKLLPQETLDRILQELPSSLSDDLNASGMMATVAKDKPVELVLIRQVKLNADAFLGSHCQQCSESMANCACDSLIRLSNAMPFLLDDTGKTWEEIQAEYWDNFFPYLYLERTSALTKIVELVDSDTENLVVPLVEMLTRMLFGDLLNPHWFRDAIERSQTASSERMALNHWTKSSLGMTLPELADRLHSQISALSGDEELPVAWLLATTNFGQSFSEELEVFLEHRFARQ